MSSPQMKGNVLEIIETLTELALSLCLNCIARKRFFLKFSGGRARARAVCAVSHGPKLWQRSGSKRQILWQTSATSSIYSKIDRTAGCSY